MRRFTAFLMAIFYPYLNDKFLENAKKRMKKIFTLSLLLSAIFLLNAQRKQVPVHQPDARFTFRAERFWLLGQEEYWFYVQNNTGQEYKIEVEVELDLACEGNRSFGLGIGAWQPDTKTERRIVYLKPNGTFEPKDDYYHYYSGGADDGKACRLKDGDTYTLFKGIQFHITAVVNVTEKKALDEQKKKEAETERNNEKAAADKKREDEKQKNTQNQNGNSGNKASNSTQQYGSQSNYNTGNNTNGTGLSNPMGNYNPTETTTNPMGSFYPPVGNSNPMQRNTNTYRTGDADIDNTMDIVNASLNIANQINGGSSTGASYGSTPSYSTGDAEVDNIVGAATGLVDILGGGTGSGGSYYPSSGDAGVDAIFGALGDAANEVNQQDRINQEAAAKRQREAAIRAGEYERVQKEKQQLAAARKSLLARYPDGQMPLSFPEISGTEVYFFVYRSSESVTQTDWVKGKYYLIELSDMNHLRYYLQFDNKNTGTYIMGGFRAAINSQIWTAIGAFDNPTLIKEVTEQEAKGTNQTPAQGTLSFGSLFNAAQTNSAAAKVSQAGTPEISISNVFAVSKFSDGTWPLKGKVIEKLGLKGSNNDITLSGYYTSRTDAEASQRYLSGKAKETAFIVSTINCSVSESAKIVAPVTDFWGNPIDKTNNSSVNTTPVKETISNKPKLDFWGNPVKD